MSQEKLAGFLSYKDKYDRYHVTSLSLHDNNIWVSDKDHFNVTRITNKYKDKLKSSLEMVDPLDNYTTCDPWEKSGFYFVIDKDKIICEKIYEDKTFESCSIDDLLGYSVVINAKIVMYKTPKFKKVGCKIQALHVKNLENIPKKSDIKLTKIY